MATGGAVSWPSARRLGTWRFLPFFFFALPSVASVAPFASCGGDAVSGREKLISDGGGTFGGALGKEACEADVQTIPLHWRPLGDSALSPLHSSANEFNHGRIPANTHDVNSVPQH